MSNTITFTVNLSGNVSTKMKDIDDITSKLAGNIDVVKVKFESFTQKMLGLNQVIEGLRNVVAGFQELSQAGLALNTSITDLSAITGVTGKKLDEIEKYARNAAKTFGGTASQSVESYKLVLSQLGPEIANVPQALASMGDSIATLSKTMGNDVTGAAEVLTTAMNQYQVSLDDPIKASEEMARMMNVMAAAAQAGSAELPAIKAALEQSGMAAKSAGVSFEETNAAIQVLDKAGKKASEGGVALRNVMMTLAQGRFLPKDVLEELDVAGISVNTLTDKSLSLAERLDALRPLMNDTALMAKMFGKENSNAAMALISGIDAMQEYTEAVSGTQSANEQAAVVMGGVSEKMSRMRAAVEDVKIGFFNLTKGIAPIGEALAASIVPIAQLLPLVTSLSTMIKGIKFSTIIASIKRITSAITSSNIATKIAATTSGLYNKAMKLLTVTLHSTKAAAATLAATLTLGLSIAIAGVVELVQALKRRQEKLREETEKNKEAEKGYTQILSNTRAELSLSIAKLKDFSGSKAEEKRLVGEMNGKYGETFGAYRTVAQWYDILVAKSEAYCRKLVLEARIRDLANRAAESLTSAEDLKTERDSTPKQHVKTVKMFSLKDWDYIDMPETGKLEDNPVWTALDSRAQDAENKVNDYQTQMEQLMNEVTIINADLIKTLSGSNNGGNDGGGDAPEIAKKVNEVLSELQKKLNETAAVNTLFGESQNTQSQQTELVKKAITDLISLGLSPESAAVRTLIADYSRLTTAKSTALREKFQLQGALPEVADNPSLKAPSATITTRQKPTIADSELSSVQQMDLVLTARLEGIESIQAQLQHWQAMLAVAQTPEEKKACEARIATYNSLTGAMEGVKNSQEGLGSGFSAMASLLSSTSGLVDDQTGSWLEWGANVMSTIAAALPQLASLMVANTAVAATEGAASVASTPYVGPILAIAAAASIIAALASIPKYAEGGIAYGKTIGMFGEYAGAVNNPEVVAPLDRLKSLIQPASNGYGEVEFVISGRNLKGVLQKVNSIDNRVN